MTIEYVLGRDCDQCRDEDEDCPMGIQYMYEEDDRNNTRYVKIFFSREEATKYIYEELGMDESEVMIIPKKEMEDDEQ
jgi:hypothetical protein